VIKLTSDSLTASLSNGKLIYANNYEILNYNLKAIPKDELKDESPISLQKKELGLSDVYPLSVKHNPNGLHFMITDQNEFIIYKSQTFNNIAFGTGSHFVWAYNGGYAVKKDTSTVTLFDSNHQEVTSIKTEYPVEDLFGGPLLGIKHTDFILFYDWDTYTFVEKIDVVAKDIFWNQKIGKLVISSKDKIYFLDYNKEIVGAALKNNEDLENGVDEAFELLYEINDVALSGIWIDDTFFYVNLHNKLSYLGKGKIFTYCYVPKNYKLIGHVSNHNRYNFFL
jgi:coatomer subunit beta'